MPRKSKALSFNRSLHQQFFVKSISLARIYSCALENTNKWRYLQLFATSIRANKRAWLSQIILVLNRNSERYLRQFIFDQSMIGKSWGKSEAVLLNLSLQYFRLNMSVRRMLSRSTDILGIKLWLRYQYQFWPVILALIYLPWDKFCTSFLEHKTTIDIFLLMNSQHSLDYCNDATRPIHAHVLWMSWQVEFKQGQSRKHMQNIETGAT